MNDMSPIRAAATPARRRSAAGRARRRRPRRAGRALAALEAVAARYAVAITPAMAALIDPADPPIRSRASSCPTRPSSTTTPEERADPIGDDAHEVAPGLIHRYPDRVLLKLVTVCAVYCRFCFRRETVGPGGAALLADGELDAALAYIRARSRDLGGDRHRRRSAASPRRAASRRSMPRSPRSST